MKTHVAKYRNSRLLISRIAASIALLEAGSLYPGWLPGVQSAYSAPQEALSGDLIQPQQLAKMLQSSSGEKPLILHVGFRILFEQAHIPGSEYIGSTAKEEGITQLRKRVQSVAKNKLIILYCGCCPWGNCPNIRPAYDLLRGMGFSQVKVLYIADNFGKEWVNAGYPVTKGEK